MTPKIKILVIDDECAVRNALEKVLVNSGCEVTTAASGAEGLEKARASKHDLITLDVDLQDGMSGFEVCAQLKKDPNFSGVPVVFISGRMDEDSRRSGFEAGGADFITKPCRISDFVPRILFLVSDGGASSVKSTLSIE